MLQPIATGLDGNSPLPHLHYAFGRDESYFQTWWAWAGSSQLSYLTALVQGRAAGSNQANVGKWVPEPGFQRRRSSPGTDTTICVTRREVGLTGGQCVGHEGETTHCGKTTQKAEVENDGDLGDILGATD